MERIKPVDIERAKFGKALLGYDREEVQTLLDRVSAELETLLVEQAALAAEIERQNQELEVYRSQDSTLKQALLLAQKTADETRASAHKEAELIVQETLQQTDRLAHELQSKITDLRWEVERLRLDKQKFLKGFRAMLEGYLREVDEAESSEASRIEMERAGDEPSVKVV